MIFQDMSNGLMSDITYLAKLKHEKVLLNGKKISLFDAFEETDDHKLVLKKGVTDLDGKIIDQDYISSFKVKTNKYMVGLFGANDAMSKTPLHTSVFGSAAMMMKDWALGGVERAYGLKKYSVADKE